MRAISLSKNKVKYCLWDQLSGMAASINGHEYTEISHFTPENCHLRLVTWIIQMVEPVLKECYEIYENHSFASHAPARGRPVFNSDREYLLASQVYPFTFDEYHECRRAENHQLIMLLCWNPWLCLSWRWWWNPWL